MESVWFTPQLADEIIKNDDIFQETHNIITDIMAGKIDITHIVENMAGVLTNKDVENRTKGMVFFTKLLTNISKTYLTELQIKFISKFYTDRLKDNHSVIPAVLEGYLSLIDMVNYNMSFCSEFLTVLFREVPCQSQLRQDRYNIYLLIKKLMDNDLEYMKSMGPDFIYGVISAMDGERDPRNLVFLFAFLPHFIQSIPLGHLTEEMFEVISCYYPIDFHPSPDDPAAVTRQDLANALKPCLCSTQEFGESCLLLLVEKLDSTLRLAQLDSLKLLTESCNTFKPETYTPFLKTLWSSIHTEILNKTDDELKFAAHEALSKLVAKLATNANTDQAFEAFVKGVLISMQTAIAESTTVAQFVQATKVLLTTANASKESCLIVTKAMIPATVAYYGFKMSAKLQVASLDFMADMYELAKHWEVLDEIEQQVNEIPQVCLTAVSQPAKEYQVAGFKTLIRVKNALHIDLVLPFVEVLIHNVQYAQDNDLLSVSVETVHAIARKYPELIMNLVVKGKCDLENLTQDKTALKKRLNLLSSLASIDDFTKIIIEEMLRLISNNDTDALKVVEALSESMSNSSMFSNEKVAQIESDHGLIDSILTWMYKGIESNTPYLTQGYTLISNTVSSLPPEKQLGILLKHTNDILPKCERDDRYFLVLESLFSSLHKEVFDSKFEDVLVLSSKVALNKDHVGREKACGLIAHFLNKAEYGQKFEFLYEILKNQLASCSRDDPALCPRLISLYGWIAKALVMRGSEIFLFWLQKIMATLTSPEYCKSGSEAVRVIMTDFPDHLTTKQHCRISLLYRQRMFQTFSNIAQKIGPLKDETKEAYLLSWGYVVGKAPKSVLINEADKICPLVIDSLDIDNKDLLLVMLDVLCHFVQTKHASVVGSLQTILPRLIKLSRYVKSMDVRIKSLQCLYEIGNSYQTIVLLPHKQDVLFDLAPSLDDKKRLVRNMAVRARSRWFLIGAPGETKD